MLKFEIKLNQTEKLNFETLGNALVAYAKYVSEKSVLMSFYLSIYLLFLHLLFYVHYVYRKELDTTSSKPLLLIIRGERIKVLWIQ